MSRVLEAFVAAAAAADTTKAEPPQREPEAGRPIESERANAIRCLTASRRDMHRATGDERDGEPITTGEAAQWAQLAAVKHPIDAPAIVEDVVPSQDQLIDMSTLAGTAVGAAGALGKIDPVAEVRQILASK